MKTMASLMWTCLTVLIAGLFSAGDVSCAITRPGHTAMQWASVGEWTVAYADFEDNPFDIEATAVFTHEESGENYTTALFYDGDDTWRFRFFASRTGRWTYVTTSGTHHGAARRLLGADGVGRQSEAPLCIQRRPRRPCCVRRNKTTYAMTNNHAPENTPPGERLL